MDDYQLRTIPRLAAAIGYNWPRIMATEAVADIASGLNVMRRENASGRARGGTMASLRYAIGASEAEMKLGMDEAMEDPAVFDRWAAMSDRDRSELVRNLEQTLGVTGPHDYEHPVDYPDGNATIHQYGITVIVGGDRAVAYRRDRMIARFDGARAHVDVPWGDEDYEMATTLARIMES